MPDFNFVQYDFADNDSIESLLSALEQYPLGEQYRVVAVNEFYPKVELLKASFSNSFFSESNCKAFNLCGGL